MRALIAIGLICLSLGGCETSPQSRPEASGPSESKLHVREVKPVTDACDLSRQRLSAVGGGALGAVVGFSVCRLATEVLARKAGTADKNRISAGCAVAGSILGYTWAADTARRQDPQLARVYYQQMTERGANHLKATCVVAGHLAERAWMDEQAVPAFKPAIAAANCDLDAFLPPARPAVRPVPAAPRPSDWILAGLVLAEVALVSYARLRLRFNKITS